MSQQDKIWMIPQDKIWMVTGDPRSRTSLTMMILDALGVPVAGHLFGPNSEKADTTKVEKLKRLNPHGFYEVPGIVVRGLSSTSALRQLGGRAIKIISCGAFPRRGFDGASAGTPPDVVDKYVLCLRNPRDVVQSQTHLLGNTEVADGDNWELAPKQMDPVGFLRGTGQFAFYLAHNPELWDRVVTVDYSDWNQSVEQTLLKLVTGLGLEPTKAQMTEAAGRFDPTTSRVIPQDAWDDVNADLGQYADMIYSCLHNRDTAGLLAIEHVVVQALRDLQLRAVSWVDIDHEMDPDHAIIEAKAREESERTGVAINVARRHLQRFWGTWTRTNPEHLRLMHLNCGGVREATASLTQARRTAQPSMLQKDCQFFRLSDKLQTVSVPANTPGLSGEYSEQGDRVIRLPLVQCGRDQLSVTQSECYSCYHHGSLWSGQERGPQRAGGQPTTLMQFASP